jgi:hypothetical protein
MPDELKSLRRTSKHNGQGIRYQVHGRVTDGFFVRGEIADTEPKRQFCRESSASFWANSQLVRKVGDPP